MTDQTLLWRLFSELPPEAQRQVLDFVAFLNARYRPARRGRAKRTPLTDDPFIGMWRDRQDLADSSAWVRDLRRKEWRDQ